MIQYTVRPHTVDGKALVRNIRLYVPEVTQKQAAETALHAGECVSQRSGPQHTLDMYGSMVKWLKEEAWSTTYVCMYRKVRAYTSHRDCIAGRRVSQSVQLVHNIHFVCTGWQMASTSHRDCGAGRRVIQYTL